PCAGSPPPGCFPWAGASAANSASWRAAGLAGSFISSFLLQPTPARLSARTTKAPARERMRSLAMGLALRAKDETGKPGSGQRDRLAASLSPCKKEARGAVLFPGCCYAAAGSTASSRGGSVRAALVIRRVGQPHRVRGSGGEILTEQAAALADTGKEHRL